jgi:uncharacterized membrane protein YfhO
VQLEAHEAERVVVTVEARQPGYLVLADLFYPGWQAEVDGGKAPIERANYLFRAVRLAPGRHTVRFDYRPASFRLGLFLSGATAFVLGAMACWDARARRAISP